MADTKITALAELTTLAEDDFFPVVDTSETTTKKVSFANVHKSVTLDHIMQSDSTDQTLTDVRYAQIITFSNDNDKQGVTTTGSRFTVSAPGDYLINFNGVAIGTSGKYIVVWLRSGTHAGASTKADNVIDSATYYTFKSTGGTAVIAVPLMLDFAAGQWFEFWWSGNNAGDKWDYTAAQTETGSLPEIPVCPSVIFTANRI